MREARPGTTAATPPVRRSRSALWSSAAIVVASGVVIAALLGFSAPKTQDVEPGISQAAATLLQLDDIRSDNLTAPAYSLTDQHGDPMTPSEFRGRSVVLTVNDDRCEDLCSLLAQDIAQADQDLGASEKDVAFVSFNANPYYPAVSDVKAWSDRHGLGKLPNWYFGTGTPAELSAAWKKYSVPVELDAKNKTVGHGAQIFFIDPNGNEVAIGEFGTESANTAPFAHAMAQMAVDLLPKAKQASVAGPSLPEPTNGGTEVGARPAPTTLPNLRKPNETISTGSGRGAATVLNFWASTCAACVKELPALEQAHQDLGNSATFLGIDVSDGASDGLAFAKRAGVTYPLLSDRQGSVSGQYRITGLPYTVILGPTGRVAVRHAGALTAEQLEYILQNLDPNPTAGAGTQG